MKKCRGLMTLVFGAAFILATFCGVTPSSAWQQVVIPYGYVGDGWDTVIIVSNISTKAINPYVLIINSNSGAIYSCIKLDQLTVGQIYVNTFGAINSWCAGNGPPIPGLFQIYVAATELDSGDKPFGVAVAINNSTWGGFGFEQYKSESVSASAIFLGCAGCP